MDTIKCGRVAITQEVFILKQGNCPSDQTMVAYSRIMLDREKAENNRKHLIPVILNCLQVLLNIHKRLYNFWVKLRAISL